LFLGYVAVAVDPCIVGKGLHEAQTTLELARPRVTSLRSADSALYRLWRVGCVPIWPMRALRHVFLIPLVGPCIVNWVPFSTLRSAETCQDHADYFFPGRASETPAHSSHVSTGGHNATVRLI